ncbi:MULTISPECIES: CU044_5270 family protein [unclassified Kribbella]|uniref:CU044_5270 family protein n=1 Tax=unclassified Kribbella TaxID=2644121 RepID=UPI0033EF9A8A
MTDLRPTDNLDRALSTLHADVETDPERIEQIRAAFLDAMRQTTDERPDLTPAANGRTTAVGVKKRGPRRRWLIAAAAAIALVAGGTLYTSTLTGSSAEAKVELDGAAQRIAAASDPVVAPGKYRYLVWHVWNRNYTETPGGGLEYLEESVREVWVPADIRGTWYRRDTSTGRHQWVKGSDEEARKAGFTFDRSTQTATAKCGAFEGGGPCAENGRWQDPSLEWIAGLPRDPNALYEQLKKDGTIEGNDRGETQLLVTAQDALQTGMLPADLRASLYRALGNLKNLKITDKAANLDGQIGIAYSSDDGSSREEIVIDPKSGAYIGSREVATSGRNQGQVLSYRSFTTATAPAPWKAPR